MNIETFFKITYGLYIVSSGSDEKKTAHISNTVYQVTAEPAQIAICTHKDNLTTEYIKKNNTFAATIIKQEVDLEFIGKYGFKSGRDFDKFDDTNYKIGKTGAPIVLDNAIGYMECEVVQTVDVGTHILFVGKVLDAQIIDKSLTPLTYTYYRNEIKGLSPKNAPTFVNKDKLSQLEEKQEAKAEIHICSVCGYRYNSDEGDKSTGIKEGTSFDDLPEDWQCPICGVGKEFFRKEG